MWSDGEGWLRAWAVADAIVLSLWTTSSEETQLAALPLAGCRVDLLSDTAEPAAAAAADAQQLHGLCVVGAVSPPLLLALPSEAARDAWVARLRQPVAAEAPAEAEAEAEVEPEAEAEVEAIARSFDDVKLARQTTAERMLQAAAGGGADAAPAEASGAAPAAEARGPAAAERGGVPSAVVRGGARVRAERRGGGADGARAPTALAFRARSARRRAARRRRPGGHAEAAAAAGVRVAARVPPLVADADAAADGPSSLAAVGRLLSTMSGKALEAGIKEQDQLALHRCFLFLLRCRYAHP